MEAVVKYLYRFKGIKEFQMFTSFIENEEWKIGKQLMKDRVELFKNRICFKKMKSDFLKKELICWPLKDEEVISWIDTIMLLKRIMDRIDDCFIADNLTIYSEFVIPYGNHLRADYLIVFDDIIIVLEFGMFNQDEKRSEERYSKKLVEAMAYSQVLRNILPKSINVFNYVMIYRPEYDLSTLDEMKENVGYNESEIRLITQYILMVLKRSIDGKAQCQLEKF